MGRSLSTCSTQGRRGELRRPCVNVAVIMLTQPVDAGAACGSGRAALPAGRPLLGRPLLAGRDLRLGALPAAWTSSAGSTSACPTALRGGHRRGQSQRPRTGSTCLPTTHSSPSSSARASTPTPTAAAPPRPTRPTPTASWRTNWGMRWASTIRMLGLARCLGGRVGRRLRVGRARTARGDRATRARLCQGGKSPWEGLIRGSGSIWSSARPRTCLPPSAPPVDGLTVCRSSCRSTRRASASPPPRSQSALGDALRYLGNQWGALQRYVEDGRFQIDNSGAERELRAVGIGRKNWLVAGSLAGSERAALL